VAIFLLETRSVAEESNAFDDGVDYSDRSLDRLEVVLATGYVGKSSPTAAIEPGGVYLIALA
jgi:hypothetical protein